MRRVRLEKGLPGDHLYAIVSWLETASA